MSAPVLAEVTRGGRVESRHVGSLVVVDPDGRVVLALGDPDRPTHPRSAVKALQALPLVASGAADALGLDDRALALACASHNAEPGHRATGLVAKVRRKQRPFGGSWEELIRLGFAVEGDARASEFAAETSGVTPSPGPSPSTSTP